MLQTAGKFATRIVLAFVALIVSHAALLACHHWHFYPDFWLAGMIVTTPSLFENELALWGLTLLGTIILWAILDYFFYRRKRTNGHPKPANGPAGGDIRKEMTLPDMLRHVGLGSVHHLSPTPEINIVHDFVSHLRQRLRSGEIRSWGQPHDKYPPDANLKPLEPIDAIGEMRAYSPTKRSENLRRSNPCRIGRKVRATPMHLVTRRFDLALKT